MHRTLLHFCNCPSGMVMASPTFRGLYLLKFVTTMISFTKPHFCISCISYCSTWCSLLPSKGVGKAKAYLSLQYKEGTLHHGGDLVAGAKG